MVRFEEKWLISTVSRAIVLPSLAEALKLALTPLFQRWQNVWNNRSRSRWLILSKFPLFCTLMLPYGCMGALLTHHTPLTELRPHSSSVQLQLQIVCPVNQGSPGLDLKETTKVYLQKTRSLRELYKQKTGRLPSSLLICTRKPHNPAAPATIAR